jgi:hypothetical protein
MAKPKAFVARMIPAKGLDFIRELCDADGWPEELPPLRAELDCRIERRTTAELCQHGSL